MKKGLLILISCVFFATSISAQFHEVKTNVFGLLITRVNLGYEYVLNENGGIQISANYIKAPKFRPYQAVIGTDVEFDMSTVSAGYRMYFSEDKVASGFFVSPYLKYRHAALTKVPVDVDFDISINELNYTISEVDIKENDFGLGLSLGVKVLSEAGFIFEFGGGLGRYVARNREYRHTESNSILDNSDKLPQPGFISGWNAHLDATIGWRF